MTIIRINSLEKIILHGGSFIFLLWQGPLVGLEKHLSISGMLRLLWLKVRWRSLGLLSGWRNSYVPGWFLVLGGCEWKVLAESWGLARVFPFFECVVLQSNLVIRVSTESGLLMWDFILGVPRKGGDWWQGKTNGSPLEVPLWPPWRDVWSSPRTHLRVICHGMDGFQATQLR